MSITTHHSIECHANAVPVGESQDDFVMKDQRKNEFLATLAHELRNPLAPIKNALQLLAFMGLSQEAEDLRAMMSRQTDQIVCLVDDLLDISRISCGKVVLHKQTLPLANIVASAVEESIGLIRENGLTLDVIDHTQHVSVCVDPGRITQVISNLLNNSAKYGRRGGRIELSLKVVENTVQFCVSDDGIGIDPDRLKDIFCMYSQIETGQSQRSSGLGIGLALVRTLVEIHDGHVEAASRGPGCGSTFAVSLPIVAESHSQLRQDRSSSTRSCRSLRVLVVDDMCAMRVVSTKLLERLGHEVRAVENGQLALDMIDLFEPDIVLSDITMPVVDGYELARQIRARTDLDSVKLIALTGYGQPSDREKAFQSGFDLHMTKPVDFEELQRLFSELSSPQVRDTLQGG